MTCPGSGAPPGEAIPSCKMGRCSRCGTWQDTEDNGNMKEH